MFLGRGCYFLWYDLSLSMSIAKFTYLDKPAHDVWRVLVLLPNCMEYGNRLLQGILEYSEDDHKFSPFEVRFQDHLPLAPHCDLEQWDAVIFWADLKHKWIQQFISPGMPAVTCGADWRGEEGICTVAVDNEMYARQALQFFQRRDKKRIAYIGYHTTDYGGLFGISNKISELSGEYQMRFLEQGLTIPDPAVFRIQSDLWKEDTQLIAFLKQLPPETGLICEHSTIARLVTNALLHLNVNIPVDIEVLSVEESYSARSQFPRISTIELPGERIGYEAAALVRQHLDRKSSAPTEKLIPPVRIHERDTTAAHAVEVTDYLANALRIINEEACHGLSVQKLSDTLQVSRTKLTLDFTERFHCSPGTAIRNRRLFTASGLLRNTNLSVNTITLQCGFTEPQQFCNFFRRYFGMTPIQYRQSPEEILSQSLRPDTLQQKIPVMG